MRTKILNELKNSFEPYSQLWDEWTNSNFCSLAKEEIYLINAHLKNNFQVNISEFIMFYNKIDLLQQAIQNLKLYYREFQEWVLIRFSLNLMSLTNQNNIKLFLDTPINELNISEDLKAILKIFNRQTLNKIFTTYTDEDFKDDYAFKNLVAFQTTLQAKQIIINS
jgi:hypothetical protein